MSEIFKYAGQAELSQFNISSANGNTYDITDLVIETQLIIGLFNNFASARITIADSSALISHLPIIGYEAITFVVKNPGFNEKTFTGFVYKISNREELTSRAAVYTLECVSYEAIKDRNTFSKSYKGRIDDIVKRIFKEHLNTGKFIELEQTNNSIAMISPYWTPMQCIDWLTPRAKSINKASSSYTFWEDLNGFHFYSLESLFSKLPRIQYRVSPVGLMDGNDLNIKSKLQRIIHYKVLESSSTLDFMMNGTFGSRLYVKNLNENSYVVKQFDLENMDKNRIKLNGNSIKINNDAFGGRNNGPAITKFGGSYIEPFTNFSDTNAYETWVLERNSFIDLLNSQRIEVVVPGLFELNPGDIVDIFIPAPSQHNVKDNILSGKYIIINQKHVLTKGKDHTMILELAKESLI